MISVSNKKYQKNQVLSSLNFIKQSDQVFSASLSQKDIDNFKFTDIEIFEKNNELITFINPKSKILTSCKVLDVKKDYLITTKGTINTHHSVFCGGLFSDRLAKKDNMKLHMRIVGFRGDYYYLNSQAKYKVKHLIYPVPNPEFPFLGVHLTRMTDGSIECGPNAVFTFKREGYGKLDFNFKDTFEALTFLGTWKLFINHWKFGLKEYSRAFSKRLFLNMFSKAESE